MRAILMDRFGGPDVLRQGEAETPVPAADEVRIRIRYAGVNPVDWKIREGLLRERLPHEFPVIPGWEAAGVVDAAGAEVADWTLGDAVYAYCRKPVVHGGTYAEFVTIPAAAVAPKPANLSYAEAAGIPLAGLTAWQSLFDHAGLKNRQTVLIHAGAGGVGSHAIQFARQAGGNVIATASAGNHDYVKRLGANLVLDYRDEDFVAAVRAAYPQGIDLVFDTLGGETQSRSYEVLKKGGALVSIVNPPDAAEAAAHGVRGLYCFVQPSGAQLRGIAEWLESGKIRAPQIEEFPLEKAADAQARSQAGHVRGKLVLRVG